MTKETVSVISIISNLVLGLLKIALGLAAKSSALVAEGLHSAIDVFSSAITFLGIKVAKREPTKEHPYGWARADVLSGLIVVVFLGLAGLQIIREALTKISGGEHGATINMLPLLVMTISVVINEVLARLKIKVGQKEESLALIADGKHSRVDVLSSGGVLIGLLLTQVFPIADSVTALLVGIYILYETVILGKEITENLLDVADPEVEEKIREIVTEQQIDLTTLKTRKIGALTFSELEISLPTETKISRADDLISELQETLISKISRLEYVVIQIKGAGKRSRMLRGQCAETLERLGPEKKGWRVIEPYRDGQPYDDFGAPDYLVTDYGAGEGLTRTAGQTLIKNPYYKIGRGHGVRFARAIQADEVKATNIGENAKEALKNLKIKISIEK
jgi:cation diffusion facilitator family transporter